MPPRKTRYLSWLCFAGAYFFITVDYKLIFSYFVFHLLLCCIIVCLICRNEATELLESNLPVWRRNKSQVKHIRGIFLEEAKAIRETRAEANASNPSTSAAKPVVNNTSANSSKAAKQASPATTPVKTPNSPTKNQPFVTPANFILVCPRCSRFKTKNYQDLVIHLYNELRYKR